MLYIDKENIESLVKSRKENDNYLFRYNELIRFIKRGLLVQYNFSKDEFLKNDYLKAWFTNIYSGGNIKSDSFCPPKVIFPSLPVKSNFLSSSPSDAYRSIYLLSIDRNVSNTIRDNQCILLGNVGEEYEVIDKLLSLEDKEILSIKIPSWEAYFPKLPLTDIILCDEHYFENKRVYDNNNNELLTALSKTPKHQINLVIITKEDKVDPAINLNTEWKNIKDLISKASGLTMAKCKVTILTTRRTHSRHLLTNYYRVIHTSCFHLKDNNLKEDVNTDIASCTSKNANEVTNDLLKLFQSIASSPARSFGDKFSNFLNFSN